MKIAFNNDIYIYISVIPWRVVGWHRTGVSFIFMSCAIKFSEKEYGFCQRFRYGTWKTEIGKIVTKSFLNPVCLANTGDP